MFSHIQVGAKDLDLMVSFYDAALGPLGIYRRNTPKTAGAAGVIWGIGARRWPQFVVAAPFDGEPATAGNGCQVSFLGKTRTAVIAAWRSALDAGGTDEGAPGVRDQYSPDFFVAYCRDPEGNKIAFVHAEVAVFQR